MALRDRQGFRSHVAAGLVCVCILALLAGCVGKRRGPHGHHGRRGFVSDVPQTQVVSTLVGGKNVFIPSTIVIPSGKEHTLSIYNTTEQPHGFAIHGLGIEAVLMPGEENEVVVPAVEKGHQIFHISCHLHTPHRTATLVVVPGRAD